MLSINPPAFVHHFDPETSGLHTINPAGLRSCLEQGKTLRVFLITVSHIPHSNHIPGDDFIKTRKLAYV
jgi:hypothetical protein